MQFRTIARSAAALALVGTVAAAPVSAQAQKDIVATAVGAGQFGTLATLLTEAGLVETLQGAGPFTVFAPTDAAFAKVPAEAVAALRADKAALTRVLTYHVVPGKIMAADLAKLADKDGYIRTKTVSGEEIVIHLAGSKVHVGPNMGSNVVSADIGATNGVIHVVDAVILPPAPAKKY
jgi:uncharacterized surface protein with fasciclin (FAS1) repeats